MSSSVASRNRNIGVLAVSVGVGVLVLGPDRLLAPEQAVVLETDPTRAREVARGHMATYLGLPNYTNNLRRLGWGEDDLAPPGSDRLVDAIVAWGDEEAVVRRVQEHRAAGADHVCLQVLDADLRAVPLEGWRRLAPVGGALEDAERGG